MAGGKRGRPTRHWAEYLRVAIWYKEIKRRSGWSDYVLDNQFAWTELGQELRDAAGNKIKLTTTYRPRVFEWIRKAGKRPSGRDKDKRWRSMEGIVEAVDSHDLFNNTKAIYNAKFWDLLQRHTVTAAAIKAGIEQLLNKFDLVQINHKDSPDFTRLFEKYEHAEVYDRCLRLSLRNLDVLSGIELLWYLNALAEPVYEIRQIIEKIADVKIEQFFAAYFPANEALGYYEDAINTFRRTRLDLGEVSNGYGFLEDLARWPILPRDWKNLGIEDCLFQKIAI